MVLRPASGDGPNVTLQADIVLNGGSDLYSAPWPSADTCACVALVSLDDHNKLVLTRHAQTVHRSPWTMS